jgi:phosphotransferase system enzyme I (PtsP)
LAPKLSFISVGTNDLTQFLFAADRANPKLAERYDWLSPAILRFLARVSQTLVGQNVRLGICGEMGGRRLEALALLGIGYRRLSITPAAVGPIKELVRKVDLAELTEHMTRLLASPPEDMRAELHKWASERDIDLD